MESKKIKNRNRNYLHRVFRLKVLFYPVVLLFYRIGAPTFIERIINRVIRLFGVNKNVHYFFKFRDFGNWFRDDFKEVKGSGGDIIFPMMAGANGNFTMLNLMLGKYFNTKDNFNPVFYVCDAALGICIKDGMLKSRDKYPWFCHECWKGYDYINKATGVEIQKMKNFLERDSHIPDEEENRIDALEDLEQCVNYSFNDIPLGRFAKKSVLRYFLTGALSGNEEQLKIYREYLKAALTYTIAFDKFIGTRDKIRCFILYNGTLVFDAIVLHYCRKNSIPFISYETFLGNNSLIYKKNNEVMDLNWEKEYRLFTAENRFPDDAATKVESFFSGLKRGDRMYAVLNKEHSSERLEGLDNYVCLFTNLNFDTAVLDKNSFFNSMEDWIYSVIEYWKSNNIQKKLIIRVHPGEMKLVTASSEFIGDRIKKAAGDFPGIIVFDSTDKVNSYELLKRMDYGLIYSSTMGLEIAWSGRPCVVAGLPWYRKKPFVISPETKEEFFMDIDLLNKGEYRFVPDREELIRTVFYTYFHRTKRFTGIKLHTPKEELNSVFDNSWEMIAANINFFDELRNELFDERI